MLDAVLSECRIGADHFQQPHLSAAKHQRQSVAPRIVNGRYTEILGGFNRVVHSRQIQNLYRRNVYGLGEGVFESYRPVKIMVKILGMETLVVFVEKTDRYRTIGIIRNEFGRGVKNNRFRRVALFESGGVGERLEGGAGLS